VAEVYVKVTRLDLTGRLLSMGLLSKAEAAAEMVVVRHSLVRSSPRFDLSRKWHLHLLAPGQPSFGVMLAEEYSGRQKVLGSCAEQSIQTADVNLEC
jgi:hypothetical protein